MLKDAHGRPVDPAERIRTRATAPAMIGPAAVESAVEYIRWHISRPERQFGPSALISYAYCLGTLLVVLPYAEAAVAHGGPRTRHGHPDSSDAAERAYALSHRVVETAFLVCSDVRP